MAINNKSENVSWDGSSRMTRLSEPFDMVSRGKKYIGVSGLERMLGSRSL
jgi:hypothetical protein